MTSQSSNSLPVAAPRVQDGEITPVERLTALLVQEPTEHQIVEAARRPGALAAMASDRVVRANEAWKLLPDLLFEITLLRYKTKRLEGEERVWLWRSGPKEFWAFRHLHPCMSPGGDPCTLGEPVGYALLKPSFPGPKDAAVAEAEQARSKAEPPPLSPEEGRNGRRTTENAPQNISKEWCISMANQEGDAAIGAGVPTEWDDARAMVMSPDNWPPMRVKRVAEALLVREEGRNAVIEALKEIAKQELSTDMSVDDQLGGDFEGAYNYMIEVARAALAFPVGEGRGSNGSEAVDPRERTAKAT